MSSGAAGDQITRRTLQVETRSERYRVQVRIPSVSSAPPAAGSVFFWFGGLILLRYLISFSSCPSPRLKISPTNQPGSGLHKQLGSRTISKQRYQTVALLNVFSQNQQSRRCSAVSTHGSVGAPTTPHTWQVLMNTKLETSDLQWTNHPADDQQCAAINQRHCKETFNLYYYQSDSDEATPTHPAWMENPYTKVSTIAADHLLWRGGERRSNIKLLRLEGLQGAGLYLAFQSQGTCMALLSVRVFFRKCPPLRRAFASFPETIPHSLVEQGVCVENAVTPPGENSQLPSMLCGEDGQWVGQPTSNCACRPGYEAGHGDERCRGPIHSGSRNRSDRSGAGSEEDTDSFVVEASCYSP
ncbi:hypothetical protein XENOCAPTIV_003800 [Xenoophorus captivus]|uniref:Eph LBD domain-containing protein n=1 Tax=Xenoophorus captivus TaxID=1517983 RepID=A0ABV0SGB4_9TELE